LHKALQEFLVAGRPSSSPTASAPSAMPTGCSYSRTGQSANKADTRNCWRREGCTQGCMGALKPSYPVCASFNNHLYSQTVGGPLQDLGTVQNALAQAGCRRLFRRPGNRAWVVRPDLPVPVPRTLPLARQGGQTALSFAHAESNESMNTMDPCPPCLARCRIYWRVGGGKVVFGCGR